MKWILLLILIPTFCSGYEFYDFGREQMQICIDKQSFKDYGINQNKIISAARKAMREWNKYLPKNFKMKLVKESQYRIYCAPVEGNYYAIFEHDLVVDNVLKAGAIRFNTNKQVRAYYEIMLHEMGHLLGLKHSDVEDATMYPFITTETGKLSQDDIDGIKAFYGGSK